ncbi:hypothetical protein [Xanthomonas albilineans]|uniref:hypothetical protein n=1 Tax=Xanthomonas albilineans TaxID=29447 RepID=UPI000AAB72D6|nr:hypothetical protein [Xanthomonas albilineans]
MVQFNLRDLKKVSDAILDHIVNDLKIEKITIADDKDFYWEIPSDQVYAIKEPPPILDIGRLTDDWEFLAPLLDNRDQAVSLMLVHVASLFRHIGQEVGQ